MRTKNFSFDELMEDGKFGNRFSIQKRKLIYGAALSFDQPTILELGTKNGKSATIFLKACREKQGHVVSVDVVDCSQISDEKEFSFVRSSSDDVDYILSKASILKSGIDLLYIDSLHTRAHVEREVNGWWPHLNRGAWIFFDDVDKGPYVRGAPKDHAIYESQIAEIEDYVRGLFGANQNDCDLTILFGGTGLAALRKWSDKGAKLKRLDTGQRRSLATLAKNRFKIWLQERA